MIAVLPLLLYPVLGLAVLQFQFALAANVSTIGIVRGSGKSETFPDHPPRGPGINPAAAASWLAVTPLPPCGAVDRCAVIAVFVSASQRPPDYVPLIEKGRF